MGIEQRGESLIIPVNIKPRASKNSITVSRELEIRIQLTAPPVNGEANKQLIDFLSQKLAIKRSQISILLGLRARKKLIALKGIDIQQFLNRVEENQRGISRER